MFLSAPRFNEDQKCMTPGPGAYNPKDWSGVLHMAPSGTPGSRSRQSILPRPSLSNIPAVRQKQLDKLIQTLEELVMTKDNEIMMLQEQLKHEKDQYAKERQVLSDQLEQAKQARQELEKRLVPANQAQAETIQRLQTALEALESTHKTKVSELEHCCKEKEDLKTELQVAQDLLSREYAKTESLSDELAKAKAELESSSVAADETVKRLHAQHTETAEGYLALIRQLEEQLSAAESKLQAETLECNRRYDAWQLQTEQQAQKSQTLVQAVEHQLELLSSQHEATKQQLASRLAENQELMAQSQMLQASVKTFEQQLESLKNQHEATQLQLTSQTTEKTELQEQLENLESKCSLLITNHQHEVAKLRAELENARVHREQLNSTVEQLRETQQRLGGDNASLRARLEEQTTTYTGQLAGLHDEIRTLVGSDKAKAQLLQAAEEAHATLSKSFSALTEAHQRALADIQDRSKELQRVMEEKAALLVAQSELKLANAQLEAQANTLTLKFEVQQTQAKTQTEQLEKELRESHLSLSSLEQTVEEQRQLSTGQRQVIEQLEAAARQNAQALAESEKGNEEQRQVSTELKRVIENLEAAARQSALALSESEKSNADKLQVIAELRQVIEKLEAAGRESAQALSDSESRSEQLRALFEKQKGIMQEQLNTMEKTLQESINQRSELTEKVSAMGGENASLKIELAAVNEKLSNAVLANTASTDRITELEKSCRDWESSSSAKEAKYQQTLADLKQKYDGEIREVTAAAEEQQIRLDSQVQALKEESDRLCRSLESCESSVTVLKSEKQAIESELERRTGLLAEASQLSNTLQIQLEAAKADKDSLTLKLTDVHIKIDSLSKSLLEKTLEHDHTKLELGKAQEAVCTLTKSKDFAEEMVRELVLTKSSLTGQIEEQKAELVELQTKILNVSSKCSALVAKEEEWGKVREVQENLLKQYEIQKEAATADAKGYQQQMESLNRELTSLKAEQEAKIEEARKESEEQLTVVRLQIESEREEHKSRLTNLRICMNEEKQESVKAIADLKEQHKQSIKLLNDKLEEQKRCYEEKLKDTKAQLDRVRREADSAASLAQLQTEKASKLQDAKLQHFEKEKELAEKETKALKQKLLETQKTVKEASEACPNQKEKYEAQVKALEKRLWEMGEKCQQEGKQNRELNSQVKSLEEKAKQAEQASKELQSTVAKLEADAAASKDNRKAVEQLELTKAAAELEVAELRAMLDQANLEVGKALGEASLQASKTSALAAHTNHKQKIHLHEQLKQENFALRKENLTLRVELKAAREEARVRASLGPLAAGLPLPRLSLVGGVGGAVPGFKEPQAKDSAKEKNVKKLTKKASKEGKNTLGKATSSIRQNSIATTTLVDAAAAVAAVAEAKNERKHMRDSDGAHSPAVAAATASADQQAHDLEVERDLVKPTHPHPNPNFDEQDSQQRCIQPGQDDNKENQLPLILSPTKQGKRVRLSDGASLPAASLPLGAL